MALVTDITMISQSQSSWIPPTNRQEYVARETLGDGEGKKRKKAHYMVANNHR